MVDRRGFLWAASGSVLGTWTGAARAQGPAEPPPQVPSDRGINEALEALRKTHGLPGMIGGVVRGGTLALVGAAGKRKRGSDEAIRAGDLVHIGSCTKAMTATLLGLLVDEGALRWDSTVREVFPDRAPELHPDFRAVTLMQLLNHRAGLPADVDWWGLGRGLSTTGQRRALLAMVMKDAPGTPPGKTFAYSNVGYALAGLMAEQVAGRPWEALMQSRVFSPLGMASAGFGAPGTPGKVDQPWGHHEAGGKVVPSQTDNAPALGPAGTVHATLRDWAKFAGAHLRGGRGDDRLLKPETFRALLTPPAGGDYACGWVAAERPWAGGKALTHSGSNTTWYATVWLAPGRGFGTLVAANQGGEAASKACDDASGALIRIATRRANAGPRTPSR